MTSHILGKKYFRILYLIKDLCFPYIKNSEISTVKNQTTEQIKNGDFSKYFVKEYIEMTNENISDVREMQIKTHNDADNHLLERLKQT